MRSSLLFCVVALAHPAAVHAITLGQVDDFQDGTTQGWGVDAPAVNIATGGPAGHGDQYLSVTSSGGAGFGSELSTRNLSQWNDNYAAAGVTAIEMDLQNLGATPLDMRVMLLSNYGVFTSTMAAPLPPGGQWHRCTFGLTVVDLTWVGGSVNDLNGALEFMGALRIRHQSGPPQSGATPIVSQLGIDNIRALPEPATLALMALGAAMLRHRRRSLPHAASSRIGGVL